MSHQLFNNAASCHISATADNPQLRYHHLTLNTRRRCQALCIRDCSHCKCVHSGHVTLVNQRIVECNRFSNCLRILLPRSPQNAKDIFISNSGAVCYLVFDQLWIFDNFASSGDIHRTSTSKQTWESPPLSRLSRLGRSKSSQVVSVPSRRRNFPLKSPPNFRIKVTTYG